VLNQQTSAVIEEVANGHPVTITKAGRPVARIVPIMPDEAVLAPLIEAGLVIPAKVRGPFPRPPRTPNSGVNIADAIAREREESRW
jgi:antitoxin (DNA-binding transcriptional repressor) of toxin-antitoxin stability system